MTNHPPLLFPFSPLIHPPFLSRCRVLRASPCVSPSHLHCPLPGQQHPREHVPTNMPHSTLPRAGRYFRSFSPLASVTYSDRGNPLVSYIFAGTRDRVSSPSFVCVRDFYSSTRFSHPLCHFSRLLAVPALVLRPVCVPFRIAPPTSRAESGTCRRVSGADSCSARDIHQEGALSPQSSTHTRLLATPLSYLPLSSFFLFALSSISTPDPVSRLLAQA